MEPQPDPRTTEEEFNAKIEEVVANLGVALLRLVVTAHLVKTGGETDVLDPHDGVRQAWSELGRSFAELMDMEPPR